MNLTEHGRKMLIERKLGLENNRLPVGVKVSTDFDEALIEVGLELEGDLVFVFEVFSMPVGKYARLHTVEGLNMDLNIPKEVYDQVVIETLMGGMIPSTGKVGTPTVIQGPPPEKADNETES